MNNHVKQHPNTYKCPHCCDVGYQTVFSYRMARWYSGQRPCCCEAAPAGQRQEFPLGMDFVRSKYGEYARQSDIEKYGVPSKAFEQFTTTNNGGTKCK